MITSEKVKSTQLFNSASMNLSLKTFAPRSFYAVALIAFGIQHILFSEFIAGRAPAWPSFIPAKTVFASLSGLVLIVTGLAIILNKKARLSLLISGLMILGWAALRNIYTISLQPEYGALLTNLFKSLSIGSGAFIVANTFQKEWNNLTVEKIIGDLSVFGVYMMGGFLLVGGIQHFLFVDFVKFLVPTWIPDSTFWTYFSGVALAAAGVGIITGLKRSLAATLAGLMVLSWVFVLHLPRAIENQNQNEWTAVFEALSVSGILLLIGEQSRK